MDISQLSHKEFDTGGRCSISQGGPLVRMAAATAKQALLQMASQQLGVPVASLTVDKGVVSGGGKQITYGQLIGGKLFNVRFATTSLNTGVPPAKSPYSYKQVGIARPKRPEIADIVTGKFTYAANVRVPGM